MTATATESGVGRDGEAGRGRSRGVEGEGKDWERVSVAGREGGESVR